MPCYPNKRTAHSKRKLSGPHSRADLCWGRGEGAPLYQARSAPAAMGQVYSLSHRPLILSICLHSSAQPPFFYIHSHLISFLRLFFTFNASISAALPVTAKKQRAVVHYNKAIKETTAYYMTLTKSFVSELSKWMRIFLPSIFRVCLSYILISSNSDQFSLVLRS